MKKIITLMLLLMGMAFTVSATTKRLYLEAQNGWAAVNLYLYDSEDNKLTGQWPGLPLNRIGSTSWFYGDVDSEITDARCIVSSNGWGQTLTNQNPNYYIIDLSKNNVIYLYNTGDGNNPTWDAENKNELSIIPFEGYVIAGNNSPDNDMQTLTQNGLTLTCTLDLAGAIGDSYFRIYPTFAKEGSYPVEIAPNSDSDFELAAFITYSDAISYTSVKTWKETAHQKYDVSVDLSAGTFTFIPYIERTLPDAAEGYATFSSTYDVIPDAGLTVKYATGVSDGQISWTDYPATGIKAGYGALLKGTAGTTYKFTPAPSAATLGSPNILKAITTSCQLANETNITKYILTKVGGHVGFYKVNSSGSYVNEGTAYLEVSPSPAREFFALDDESSSIDAVKQEVGINGECYNLAGQRVANPVKGLYIVNGKKVVIK